MSKKTHRKAKSSSPRRFPLLWAAIAGAALLFIAGGLILTRRNSENLPSSDFAPEVTGAPRLVVAQDAIDEGYIKLNKTVRTTFHLKNVGDQPLKILDEPQVKLVEGC